MADSNTFVIQTVARKVTSIRVDPHIKDMFKAKVDRQGLSMCHVLESLMYAYSVSTVDEPRVQQPPITVNVKVERFVSKARRKGISFNEDVEIIYRGEMDSCYDCGSPLVSHWVAHFETPIRCVREFVCRDCFKLKRRIGECQYWKEMKRTF